MEGDGCEGFGSGLTFWRAFAACGVPCLRQKKKKKETLDADAGLKGGWSGRCAAKLVNGLEYQIRKFAYLARVYFRLLRWSGGLVALLLLVRLIGQPDEDVGEAHCFGAGGRGGLRRHYRARVCV